MEKLKLKIYYKSIPESLEWLDEMMYECKLRVQTRFNNGYGCLNDNEDGNTCMSCYCPIAHSASLSEIKEHDKGRYNDYKLDYPKENDDDTYPDNVEDHPMIQYQEVTKIEGDYEKVKEYLENVSAEDIDATKIEIEWIEEVQETD